MNESNKILCEKCGFYPAVGEIELGNDVKFYCRNCMMDAWSNLDEIEIDESLVFCEREWNEQK